jgi:hypothetical protein
MNVSMRLPCGDRVREPDGHHVGRVEASHHRAFVKVKWEDTAWISEYRAQPPTALPGPVDPFNLSQSTLSRPQITMEERNE